MKGKRKLNEAKSAEIEEEKKDEVVESGEILAENPETKNRMEKTMKKKRRMETPEREPSKEVITASSTSAPAPASVPAQPQQQQVQQANKKKKPKHLQRKLAQAVSQQDASIIQEITLQQQELNSIKAENARKWKETCKKLIGSEKWDEAKFDLLIGKGVEKKKLLEVFGIDVSDEQALKRKFKDAKYKLKKGKHSGAPTVKKVKKSKENKGGPPDEKKQKRQPKRANSQQSSASASVSAPSSSSSSS